MRIAVAVGVAVVILFAVTLSVRGGDSDPARPPVTTTSSFPRTTSVPPAVPVVSRVETAHPVVFFTIDDGLARDQQVIRFIRRRRIPVTLFLVPGYVRADPTYFQRLQELGASIQDHSVSHVDMRGLGSAGQVREICDARDELTLLFGQRPWMFRPPGGHHDVATRDAVALCGLEIIVMWQGTMNDGVLALQHDGPLRAGDIVLLHFRDDLRENLEVLLEKARDAGLKPARLEDYLPSPPP